MHLYTRCPAKEVLAWQILEAMKAKNMTRKGLAEKMKTSRSQISRLLDPSNYFFVDDLVAFECVAGRVYKSRNDHRSKIEHETVGIGHHRHVTAVPAGGA